MKMYSKPFLIIFLSILVSAFQAVQGFSGNAPYPPSKHIKKVEWTLSQNVRKAPGSDLWPVTWARDNHLYLSWGDGGGFGGSNSIGRVSLGFARLEGTPEHFRAVNIWGGADTLNMPQFDGKCAGMISVDGTLYAWINMQNGNPPDLRLAWSEDFAKTWKLSEWAFSRDQDFFPSTFLNYGKDNAGARDDYAYSYGARWIWAQGKEDHLYLVRVKKQSIRQRSEYQFYAGLNDAGEPIWTPDAEKRSPVFSDSNGVGNSGLAHVVFNPGINRYILSVGHRSGKIFSKKNEVRCLGIFDGETPWGPWTTVVYYDDWGGYDSGEALGYDFPTKWISQDGRTMWMIYSSEGDLDSFNLVKATLILP